jgi:hypothetical protein
VHALESVLPRTVQEFVHRPPDLLASEPDIRLVDALAVK